jgi:hypothetical protein
MTTKWKRRDRKRRKARWGMRMDGKATKTVLSRLAATSSARHKNRSPRR